MANRVEMSSPGPSHRPTVVRFRRAADTVVEGQPNRRIGRRTRLWALERDAGAGHVHGRKVLRDLAAGQGRVAAVAGCESCQYL